ncbi:MAG: MFS transporter, partial [Geminicoccaceae bacterium]
GYLGLLGIDAGTPYASLWWRLLAVPLGIGLAVPPMTSALLSTVDRSRFGVASGVLNAVRQTGAVLGVALFGSLIAGRDGLVSGLHGALSISALALLAGCITALLFIRSPCSRPEPPTPGG